MKFNVYSKLIIRECLVGGLFSDWGMNDVNSAKEENLCKWWGHYDPEYKYSGLWY